ncbi:MAG: hypothetical protein KJ714_00695, partial [Euryarchaeota archaeon]|nr:hypothetical protein [Euryarchaeota archaeon]
QQSKKVAMRESFDIMGSGIALRITSVDTLINITDSYGGRVNLLEYDFSIPATIANEGYSINVTNTSYKRIILEADNGAKAWVPFNVSSNLTEKKIYSSTEDYKFIYNRTENTIKIEEQ